MILVEKQVKSFVENWLFATTLSVNDGVQQVSHVFLDGNYGDMYDLRNRNVHFIDQQCCLGSNLGREKIKQNTK